MPADEETRGTAVEEPRARSGPRHALPRKPFLTRLQVPAGKAIAVAAMPTAVLMGMGFTPTLAQADDPAKKSNSLTIDEYKDCVEALADADEEKKEKDEKDEPSTASPTPSASETPSGDEEKKSADSGSTGGSSPDSGSGDDKPESSPSASAAKAPSKEEPAAPEPTPSASETRGNVLEEIGDALKDIFTPGKSGDDESTSPSPSATPSAPAAGETSGTDADDKSKDDKAGAPATATAKARAVDAGDAEEKPAADEADDAAEAEPTATPTPTPSASETADLDDCPVATEDEGGLEKGIPPLPDAPWYLNASSLLLKGADYQGVVKVKTAGGQVKEVLKYVVSDGTDIGDLHQTVQDEQSGKTYHVQAAKGSTSTIRDGDTVMYTEEISGNLLGLIPVTFNADNPPPLNIPLIYFTKVKVTQAGQFGGTLHVPGLHSYQTG